jgi:dipeptidyl-peptidase-3
MKRILIAMSLVLASACGSPAPTRSEAPATPGEDTRQYLIEQVDDAAVVQLYADGFTALPLKEKILIWHLYQAAISGRDIFYDQRYAHNLEMRDVLEAIVTHSAGIDRATLAAIERYTKLFWINTGPYNNLTARKFVLTCSPDAFAAAAHAAAKAGAQFPMRPGETLDDLLTRLRPLFFDVTVDPMVTAKTPPPGKDILTASANNLYAGVTIKDLDGFREVYGVNSRLVKTNGRLEEQVYRVDGMYRKPIAAIVAHLEQAVELATPAMAEALRALIRWYRTGEPKDRMAYDVAWVKDTRSPVDTINGFIEVYLDARGVKGAWEALVYYVNHDKTADIQKLARDAQWFEDRMPWDPAYRKPGVRGISANAIEVVIETGDSGPITPIGINLPNDQTVREQYGSKSVSLSNVNVAYERSQPPSLRSEFAWTPEEAERGRKWGAFAGELTTNMHEVIGHASGKVAARLQGNPQAMLKEHYSELEESRADLVALYFLPDDRLVELGLIAAADRDEIVRAEYEHYARNALVQLRRVREGTQIEEAHMRNRQMIVHWLLANTNAIERRRRDGKTYYVVVDVAAFREGVGRLLAEVQRIKSEGDYDAAHALFEAHGIHFAPALRDEIVARVEALELPSYTGFVMPRLQTVTNAAGEITDVTISYPLDLTAQMLEYSAATRPLR